MTDQVRVMRRSALAASALVLLAACTPNPAATPIETAEAGPGTTSGSATSPVDGLYVSSIDGESVNLGNTWEAEVVLTVVDGDQEPVPGAVVTASWDKGDDDLMRCTTNEHGHCHFTSSAFAKRIKSATFQIEDIAHEDLDYLGHLDAGRDLNDSLTTLAIPKP